MGNIIIIHEIMARWQKKLKVEILGVFFAERMVFLAASKVHQKGLAFSAVICW